MRFAWSVSVFVSPNNPEADQVLHAMRELHSELQQAATLDLATRPRWLVFLSETSFDGQMGEQLAIELAAALEKKDVPLVLYSPEDGEFGEIMCATPRHLKEAGLYGPLALEWRDGVHRVVSENLLAHALGARDQRTCQSLWWLRKVCAPRTYRARVSASGSVELHSLRSGLASSNVSTSDRASHMLDSRVAYPNMAKSSGRDTGVSLGDEDFLKDQDSSKSHVTTNRL